MTTANLILFGLLVLICLFGAPLLAWLKERGIL